MAAPRPDKSGSLVYATVVYLIACAVAWWTFQLVQGHPLSAMATGYAASVAVIFAAGLHCRNGSIFDPWWSVLPPFAALFLRQAAPQPEWTSAQLAVVGVVLFWAVRLTSNWARDWPGLGHEDWRYTMLYERAPLPPVLTMLIAVMVVPAIFVTLGSLPLYPALALGDGEVGLLGWAGVALGVGATLLAFVADEQMRSFRRSCQPGQLMDRGLWAWSRHPNYLGEILFWVSLWLLAVDAAPGWWWTGVGALAMAALFVFGSVPMLDTRSRERRPEFDAYAARTPALLLRPPRRS